MSEETKVELPAVVTFADLVDSTRAYIHDLDSDWQSSAITERARLNAIAERLGLVDVPGRVEALKATTKRVMDREAERAP